MTIVTPTLPTRLEIPTPPRRLEAAFSSFVSPTNNGHNEQSSNVRVVARIRPMLPQERERGLRSSIHPISMNTESDLVPSTPTSGQKTIIERCRRSTLGNLARFSPLQNKRSKEFDRESETSPQNPSSINLTPRRRNSQFNKVEGTRHRATGLIVATNPIQRQFEFDAVFGEEATQIEVYNESVEGAVRSNILRGYNTTIIAYGQTGSGKTYTMGGNHDIDVSSEYDRNVSISDNDGVIPRAICDLFRAKQQCHKSAKVKISLTYLEIYNDDVRDLLLADDDNNRSLNVRDQGDEGGCVVEGLQSVDVDTVGQVYELIDEAAQRRTTSSTFINEQSSRSHAICTLTVTMRANVQGATNHFQSSSNIVTAKLTLVDLAGSERIKQTGVLGVQQQESITINKDLFVLGKVISALADKCQKDVNGKGNKKHIPYRDSKLTRLLRDSIGGNCFTVFIACVSPAEINVEESLNTLRYAERTRSIKNSIKQNVIKSLLSPVECASIQKENRRLRAQIEKLKRQMLLNESRRSGESLLDSDEGSPEMKLNISDVQGRLCDENFNKHDQEKIAANRWKMKFKKIIKPAKPISYAERSPRKREIELKTIGKGQLMQNKVSLDGGSSSCLNYELAISDSNDSDLLDTDPESMNDSSTTDTDEATLDKDSLVRPLNEQALLLKQGIWSLKEKNRDLTQELRERREELNNVNNLIRIKNAELTKAESNLVKNRLGDEEGKRDVAKKEISLMKLQLEQVSDDLNETNCTKANNCEITPSTDDGEKTRLKVFVELLSKHIMKLSSNNERENKKLTDLESNLNCEKLRAQDLERLVSQTQEKLDSLLNENQSLQRQVEALKDVRQQNIRNHEDNENRKLRSGTLEAQLISEKELLRKNKEQHERLKKDFVCLSNENSDLQCRIARKDEEFQKKINELETQLVIDKGLRKEESFESCNEEIEFIKNDKIEFCSQVASQEHEKSQEQIIYLKSQLADEKRRLKESKDHNKKLEQDIKCLEKEKNELSSLATVEADKSREKISDLESQLRNEKQAKHESELGHTKVKQDFDNLSSELSRLRSQKPGKTNEIPSTDALKEADSGAKGTLEENGGEDVINAEHSQIRTHAEHMLAWADEAISKPKLSVGSLCSSIGSSIGTEFRPSKPHKPGQLTISVKTSSHGKPPMVPNRNVQEDNVIVDNLEIVKKDSCSCQCQSKLFSERTEHVEFYLPKLGLSCTCGRQPKPETNANQDICALESILREWQVEFLKSVGINDTVALIRACVQRNGVLAKQMRSWRRKKGLPGVKTRSCAVALHIWGRTCKTYVKSIRKQQAEGVITPKRPEFLDVSFGESRSMSTLGCGSLRSR